MSARPQTEKTLHLVRRLRFDSGPDLHQAAREAATLLDGVALDTHVVVPKAPTFEMIRAGNALDSDNAEEGGVAREGEGGVSEHQNALALLRERAAILAENDEPVCCGNPDRSDPSMPECCGCPEFLWRGNELLAAAIRSLSLVEDETS